MPLRWHEPQADDLGLLNRFDNFSGLRNGLRKIASGIDEWAGIPMPIDGERLVIEPSYRNAAGLMAMGAAEKEDAGDDLPGDIRLRNEFWSERLRCWILIWEEGGKILWGKVPGFHHIGYDIRTMGCSLAWGLEQEARALQLLGTLVRHHQLKQYLLTGMFLETSKRSGLTYMFRKLKPTVVLDCRDQTKEGTRILCALCMHPIAHYANSWAGAMCPSDDVIAHLMLMRGDEHMLWRRANQHPASRPEAGL